MADLCFSYRSLVLFNGAFHIESRGKKKEVVMFRFSIRHTALLLLIHAIFFVSFLNIPSLRHLSGFFFGSFILLLNVLLSVFLFTRVHFLNARGTLLHRLALLLAIFIKGVNLLFLTYLGVKALGLGVFPIVSGAMLALVGSCAFFVFKSVLQEDKCKFF